MFWSDFTLNVARPAPESCGVPLLPLQAVWQGSWDLLRSCPSLSGSELESIQNKQQSKVILEHGVREPCRVSMLWILLNGISSSADKKLKANWSINILNCKSQRTWHFLYEKPYSSLCKFCIPHSISRFQFLSVLTCLFLGKRPQELIDPLWPQIAQSLVHPILCWQVDLGGGIKAELWLGGSKCTVAVVQQFLGPPVKAHPVQSWASRSHLQLCTWSCVVSLFWFLKYESSNRRQDKTCKSS